MAGEGRKTICMIGTTGVGKSSLANILMGIDPWEESPRSFTVGADAVSCTLDVDAKDGSWLGNRSKPVRFLDTPGHGDGKGQDQMLRKRLAVGMKREKLVHVFVWVKNFQSPRFDDLDKQFYDIFGRMFGRNFVSNMVVVFTRHPNSAAGDRMRQRTKSSLENTIAGFRQSIGDIGGTVPMFAIDALYDKDSPRETQKFQESCGEMWAAVQNFSMMPIEHVEVVQDNIAELIRQISILNTKISSMSEEHSSEMQKLKDELHKAGLKQRELERKLAYQTRSFCPLL